MSSARGVRFWTSLAFRLTVLYGGVLVASALLCFVIAYVLVVSAMRSRTDTDLVREAQRCDQAYKQGGVAELKELIERDSRATGLNDIFFVAYSASGDQIVASDLSSWGDIVRPAAKTPNRQAVFNNAPGSGHHEQLRVLTYPMVEGTTLQVGITVEDDVRVVQEVRKIISLVMIVLTVAAVAVGWFVAKRALVGVQRLQSTAKEITGGALDKRVPTSGSGDEIDELAITFNGMLERIQALVGEIKANNDNIAHELRSPITRMRGLAETTLTGQGALEGFRDMAASTIEECDRLLTAINTMLDIAEAEAGATNLKISPFDLAALVRDAYEFFEPMISERQIRVSINAPESVTAVGDLHMIQRVLANLLDNAVKYAPSGGTVVLNVARTDAGAQFTVSNNGETIAALDLPNIFKRFYRGASSRSGPGNGLGLSLAQAIVHAHGGTIRVESNDGQTVFHVLIPDPKITEM